LLHAIDTEPIVLQYNAVLEELHLDTNQIDDDGVSHLASMLAVNKSIRTLNLAANRIGDVGMAALAEMLKVNTTLTELDLSSNEIGYDGMIPTSNSMDERRHSSSVVSNDSSVPYTAGTRSVSEVDGLLRYACSRACLLVSDGLR
jgi:NLR family CARD domain-containing protein 3